MRENRFKRSTQVLKHMSALKRKRWSSKYAQSQILGVFSVVFEILTNPVIRASKYADFLIFQSVLASF